MAQAAFCPVRVGPHAAREALWLRSVTWSAQMCTGFGQEAGEHQIPGHNRHGNCSLSFTFRIISTSFLFSSAMTSSASRVAFQRDPMASNVRLLQAPCKARSAGFGHHTAAWNPGSEASWEAHYGGGLQPKSRQLQPLTNGVNIHYRHRAHSAFSAGTFRPQRLAQLSNATRSLKPTHTVLDRVLHHTHKHHHPMRPHQGCLRLSKITMLDLHKPLRPIWPAECDLPCFAFQPTVPTHPGG